MAWITTHDCERFVPNRFELVLLAAERAHRLKTGAEPLIIAERDEPATVLALREIASGRIEAGRLRENLVEHFSRVDPDRPFDEPHGRLVPGFLPDGSREGPSGGRAPARVH